MAKSGITYKGKPFKAEDFMKDVGSEMAGMAAKEIGERLGKIKCPEHKQAPVVKGAKMVGGALSLDYETCCEKLEKLVSEQVE